MMIILPEVLMETKVGNYRVKVHLDNIQVFDINDNLIHIKDSNGFESWYNANGDIISRDEFDKLNA